MADIFFFIFILIIIILLIILLYFPVLSTSKSFTLSFNPKPIYSVISDEPAIYVNINNERIKTEPVYFIRRSFRFFLYTDYMMCTRKIFSEKNNSAFLPVQKYHGLLIKGFSKAGAEVRCFSGLPVNRSITDRKLIREKDEQEGNAYHHYITTINYPIIRHLMVFFGSFFSFLPSFLQALFCLMMSFLLYVNTLFSKVR